MDQSVVFLPVVGIRAGAYISKWTGFRPDANDNDVWSFAGPCCICNWWGIYGDAGDYCEECN